MALLNLSSWQFSQSENIGAIILKVGRRMRSRSRRLCKRPFINHLPPRQLEAHVVLEDELLLLHRARALDAEALEEIHNRYYVSIYRYIVVRVNDSQLAEDLASDVFMRFLSALRDKTAPQKTIRGWLFAVASRVVKDHYRKKYRRPVTELDENLEGASGDPLAALTEKLSRESLHEAITELTEDQQNVIALRFGYDMSIKETADTMGKSEGSIKMLQARAVAALARLMGKDEASNG